MSYKILTIALFDKQFKRLAKKYPSLKKDLANWASTLANNPEQGIALGNQFFKVRFAISSKTKGKSGGARVITYVKKIATTLYLTAIYDKSEKESISDKELQQIFKTLS